MVAPNQYQDIGKHRCDDEKLGGEDDDEDEKGAICEWDLMMASTHPANHSIPHHLILTVWMEPIGKYHYVAVLVPVV